MITLGLSYDENMFVDKTELASITKCKIGVILEKYPDGAIKRAQDYRKHLGKVQEWNILRLQNNFPI